METRAGGEGRFRESDVFQSLDTDWDHEPVTEGAAPSAPRSGHDGACPSVEVARFMGRAGRWDGLALPQDRGALRWVESASNQFPAGCGRGMLQG